MGIHVNRLLIWVLPGKDGELRYLCVARRQDLSMRWIKVLKGKGRDFLGGGYPNQLLIDGVECRYTVEAAEIELFS